MSLIEALGYELEITSLPDSTCKLNGSINISKEPLTISGDPYKSCVVKIQSTNTSRILISILTSNITATGFEYFYIERLEHEDQCYNQYVALRRPLQTCNVHFWHKNAMHLHFRGDFSISIDVDKTLEAGGYVRCPEDINQEDIIGQASGCKMKGYESVIQCKESWGFDIRCNVQCPYNCSCILGDNEVVYSCPKTYYQHQIKNNFLLFPGDITLNLGPRDNEFRFVLDFSWNDLTALMPDSFKTIGKHISSLFIFFNKLVSLPPGSLNGLHELNSLYLSKNHLNSLPPQLFNGLYELGYLSLSNNHLEALPQQLFEGLYKLYYISLDANYVESLPSNLFKGLHKLQEISLNHNRLKSLSPDLFDGLHELNLLRLNHNYLESLPADLFNGLQELNALFLHHNYMESLPADLFKGLYQLQFIPVLNNILVSLSPGLFNSLRKLQILWLHNNNLHLLPAGIFNDLDSLVVLDIKNNSLVSLPTKSFETNGLLEKLYLADNQLRFLSFHLLDNLNNLVLLDLSNNSLTQIPRLGQMTRLSTLKLIGNPLTGITHEHFDGIPETATTVVDQSVVCVCYMNNSDTCFNINERSPYLTCGSLLSLTVLSIFTWILGICATIGNGFVLLWKQSKHSGKENNVQSLLLSNLAASDLLMGIYMIILASADAYYREYFPMNAEEWRLGPTCRIASTLAFTSSEASVFFVTLISIDRYINIKFPYTIHKLRIKSTRWCSFIVWAISLTLGLSASISAGRNSAFYDNSHVCIGLPLAQLVRYDTNTTSVETETTIDNTYFHKVNVVENEQKSPGLYFSVAIFICLNMLCFLLILFCYIVIIKTVSQTSKAASRQRDMTEEIRMTVKVSAIVLTDFFCWFPICLIGALVQAGVVTIPADVFAWVVTFVLPINSAINPFMYTIGSLIGDKCGKKSPSSNQVPLQPVS